MCVHFYPNLSVSTPCMSKAVSQFVYCILHDFVFSFLDNPNAIHTLMGDNC